MQFKQYTAYSVRYRKNGSSYANDSKLLCIEVHDDYAVFKNSKYNEYGYDDTLTIRSDDEIVSCCPIIFLDWADEYISEALKFRDSTAELIRKVDKEIEQRKHYIANRPFLNRALDFIEGLK